MCSLNPCKNGGTCMEHNRNHSYTCKCHPHYEGRNCEIGNSFNNLILSIKFLFFKKIKSDDI